MFPIERSFCGSDRSIPTFTFAAKEPIAIATRVEKVVVNGGSAMKINGTQILGNFVESASPCSEYLIIGFSPSSISLQQRWRNNGLSANFIADYLITFFPIDENAPDALQQRNKLANAARYVANELLENAMNFSDEASKYPVRIRLELRQDYLVFYTNNSIKSSILSPFQTLIQGLITTDSSELSMAESEKNTQQNLDRFRSGLITIMNDYRARLGWKFETIQQEPEIITVTTTVQLPL